VENIREKWKKYDYFNIFNIVVEDIEENLFKSSYEIALNYEVAIINYINNNPDKNLKYSNIFGYETFSKMFLIICGISPQKYVVLRKLNIGREQLQRNEYSIQIIGEKLGYENVKTFNKNFKKYFGLTPGEYREKREIADEFKENIVEKINLYRVREKMISKHSYKNIENEIVYFEKKIITGIKYKNLNHYENQNIKVWEQMYAEVLENQQKYNPLKKETLYAVADTKKFEKENPYKLMYDYYIGYEFANDEKERELYSVEIEAGEYLHFIHKGEDKFFNETVDYILGYWVPANGYAIQSIGINWIEVYGERYTGGSDSEIDIYIKLITDKE
jgi:predicted transcriptional regulator YdeE/AraC-like DNA-binding protein